MMAKHGAQNQLNVEYENRQPRERNQAGPAVVDLNLRDFFYPPPPGEHSDTHGDAEERLCHGGVRRRDPRRLQQQYCQAAKNCLGDHGAEGGGGQPFHPTAAIPKECPGGK